MYLVGIIMLVLAAVLIMDWHARMVFVACIYPRRYGHGKSWKRAYKHYKNTWSLFQRLFWIPLLKESYGSLYRVIAFLAYTHAVFALITGCWFLVDSLITHNEYWIYVFVVFFIFTIIRFIFDNAIAKGIFK